MNNSRTTRQSNIELLRVLCMLGVVVLHFNNPVIGGAIDMVPPTSMHRLALCVAEGIAVCAVDLFVLITGYFMCNSSKSRSVVKPVKLLVQVILFNELWYLIESTILHRPVDMRNGVFYYLFPASYFAILYAAIYLVSPLINKAFNGMRDSSLDKVVIALLVLFSIEPYVVELLEQQTGMNFVGLSFVSAYGNGDGYNIVNFVLMYIIGLWIRRREDMLKQVSAWLIAVAWIIDVAIIVWIMQYDWNYSLEYLSPFVIIQAALLFVLFSRLNIQSRIINSLAKATFSVYLLNGYMLHYVDVNKIVAQNIIVMIVEMALVTIVIYLLCWILELIYSFVMDKVIWNRIPKGALSINYD